MNEPIFKLIKRKLPIGRIEFFIIKKGCDEIAPFGEVNSIAAKVAVKQAMEYISEEMWFELAHNKASHYFGKRKFRWPKSWEPEVKKEI